MSGRDTKKTLEVHHDLLRLPPCLKAALKYSREGFSVIPLAGKKQPIGSWSEFQHRRAGDDEILNWWFVTPEASVGIVCGKISGGLVVVDIDCLRAAAYLMKTDLVQKTRSVCTPRGGLHLYFRQKELLPESAGMNGGIGDIKAEGSYVVAPPSEHYFFYSVSQPARVSDPLALLWSYLDPEHERRAG